GVAEHDVRVALDEADAPVGALRREKRVADVGVGGEEVVQREGLRAGRNRDDFLGELHLHEGGVEVPLCVEVDGRLGFDVRPLDERKLSAGREGSDCQCYDDKEHLEMGACHGGTWVKWHRQNRRYEPISQRVHTTRQLSTATPNSPLTPLTSLLRRRAQGDGVRPRPAALWLGWPRVGIAVPAGLPIAGLSRGAGDLRSRL